MKDETLVRVLCGSCGRLICRVVDSGDRLAYRITVGSGGLNTSNGAVFCADHGWPNLNDPKLLAKVDAARAANKTTTHRARCYAKMPHL